MKNVIEKEIIRNLYSPIKLSTKLSTELKDKKYYSENGDSEIYYIPLFLPFPKEKNCICSDIYSLLLFFYSCGYEGVCNYNEKINRLICRLGNGIENVLIISETEPQEIPFTIIIKPEEGIGEEDKSEEVINCYRSCIFYSPKKGKIMEFGVNLLKKISEKYIIRLLQSLVEEKLERRSYIF
jgi:hypothetical protein